MTQKFSLVFIALALGCQPPAHSFPGGLTEGAELTLSSRAELPCSISISESLRELQRGGGTLLRDSEAFKTQQTFRLHRALNQGQWWAVSVVGPSEEELWLKVPFGEPQGCLSESPGKLMNLQSEVGQAFTYLPTQAECNTIEAFGTAPEALLVDAEPGLTLKVTGVRLLAGAADLALAGEPGVTLWYSFGEQLSVRDDTFHTCFSSPSAESPSEEEELSRLLNTPKGRCTASEDGRHLSCASTLGAWEGGISPTTLRLSRVNRTVGPMHFWDSVPVDGRRFASTVVSFSIPTGARTGADVDALNRAIIGSVSRALSEQSANEIRLAEAGESNVTHRVSAHVSKLVIGEPSSRTERMHSRYKSGERDVDNPEYPSAIVRRDEAIMNLSRAQTDYQESVVRFEETKRIAIDECKRRAAEATDEAKVWANMGCDAAQIAGSFVQPSRGDLNDAEQELANSRQHLLSTPETLREDVFSDWEYEQTVYSRSASAEIQVTVQGEDAKAESIVIPFRHDWSDYEVAGDSAHGVVGHSVNRSYLESSTSFVQPIGDQISDVLARRLTTILRTAGLDAARRAFAKQSGTQGKIGFEDVDAVAFDTAGVRLGRAEIRGRATLTAGSPFDLPTAAIVPLPEECILVVAVETIGDESAGLIVRTVDNRSYDGRRSARAFVEICAEDRSEDAVPGLQILSASHNTTARFGIYRTKSEAPKSVQDSEQVEQ